MYAPTAPPSDRAVDPEAARPDLGEPLEVAREAGPVRHDVVQPGADQAERDDPHGDRVDAARGRCRGARNSCCAIQPAISTPIASSRPYQRTSKRPIWMTNGSLGLGIDASRNTGGEPSNRARRGRPAQVRGVAWRMAAIEAHDLQKRFGGSGRMSRRAPVDAVRGISFTVERGERVAYIGPNGAGKSTSIKMLTGILYPTAARRRCSGWCRGSRGGRWRGGSGRCSGSAPSSGSQLAAAGDARPARPDLRPVSRRDPAPARRAGRAARRRRAVRPAGEDAVARRADALRARRQPAARARPCCSWTSRRSASTSWPSSASATSSCG